MDGKNNLNFIRIKLIIKIDNIEAQTNNKLIFINFFYKKK
jgi:hypothetical protein